MEGLWVMLAVAGAAAMLGAAVVRYLSQDARSRRLVRKAPRYRIADFPDGVVGRVVGRVVASRGELAAPLSAVRCVCFELILESKGDETDDVWGVRNRGAMACAFCVEDSSGTVVVEPESVTVAREGGRITNVGENPDAQMAAALAHVGVDRSKMPKYPTRLIERVVTDGERVCLLGVGHWEVSDDPAAALPYRDVSRRLVLRDPGKQPLIVADPE